MSIFKSCDVRGVVGEEWTAEDALRIGGSLGRMVQRRGQTSIWVGGDFRRSTAALKSALIEGLRRVGIDVQDVGHVPTPVVQFAAREASCPNLAIVTASHNPGRYNGVKFLVGGRPAIPDLMAELQAGLDTPWAPCARGALRVREVTAEYERWVIRCARELLATTSGRAPGRPAPEAADRRGTGLAAGADQAPLPRRVAVDAMGGACTDSAARVLAAAGYDVVNTDTQLDPDYALRDPNPARDRNLLPLIEAVRAERAELGVALDGDGDRVIFVAAEGGIARPEQIAALLIDQCFPGGTVVFDLKCASLVARTALAHRGTPIMQPSGHGFIKTTLLDRAADLGVEVSGHHFFGVLKGGDDGLFTALVVLGLLQRLHSSLHAQLQRIGWPCITPDLRLPFAGDCCAALESIAAHCGGQVSRLDGVRAEYPEGWGLARASITEPAMTFRFEGRDRDQLRCVVTRFLAGLPALQQQLLDSIS